MPSGQSTPQNGHHPSLSSTVPLDPGFDQQTPFSNLPRAHRISLAALAGLNKALTSDAIRPHVRSTDDRGHKERFDVIVPPEMAHYVHEICETYRAHFKTPSDFVRTCVAYVIQGMSLDVLDVDNSALAAADVFFEFADRTRLKGTAANSITNYAHALDTSMRVGDWSGIYEQLTQLKKVLDGIGSPEWRRYFWTRIEEEPVYAGAIEGLRGRGWNMAPLVEEQEGAVDNTPQQQPMAERSELAPVVEQREALPVMESNMDGGS